MSGDSHEPDDPQADASPPGSVFTADDVTLLELAGHLLSAAERAYRRHAIPLEHVTNFTDVVRDLDALADRLQAATLPTRIASEALRAWPVTTIPVAEVLTLAKGDLFVGQVKRALDQGLTALALDFTHTREIDGLGALALLGLQEYAADRAAELLLANVAEDLLPFLRETRIDERCFVQRAPQSAHEARLKVLATEEHDPRSAERNAMRSTGGFLRLHHDTAPAADRGDGE